MGATVATLALAVLAAAAAGVGAGFLLVTVGRASPGNPASFAGEALRAAVYAAAAAVMLARLPSLVEGGARGLGLDRFKRGDAAAVAAGVVAVTLLRGVGYAYLAAIGAADHVQFGLEGFAVTTPAAAACAIVIAMTLAPFAEELFFRGLIFGSLERRTTPLRAAAASGLLFAVSRVDLVLFPFFALYGTLLALLYRRTKNLWVPIAIRAIFDGATTAALVWLDFAAR